MLLYRISKNQYAGDLSGEGAQRAGGRWNSKGVPLVYTSETATLATLEVLVHFPMNIVPKNMSIAAIDFPDDLSVIKKNAEDLPADWEIFPVIPICADIGDEWIKSCESVALRVPSVFLPDGPEYNYLLNPAHPDYEKISVYEIKSFQFDKRLFMK